MQNVKTQLLRRRSSFQPSALHSSPLLLQIVIVFLVILIFPDMVMVLPVNMLIILLLHTLMVLLGFAKDFGVYGCQFHTKDLAALFSPKANSLLFPHTGCKIPKDKKSLPFCPLDLTF